MQVDIHQNFLAALRKLTEPERDSIRRTVDILYSHGFTPGMRRHMVGAFLSISPNMDLRVLAREQDERVVLLHVDHHDKAYDWANRTALLDTSYEACEILPISKVLMLHDDQRTDSYLPIPVANLLELKDENLLLHAVESLSPEWQEWILSKYIDTQDIPPPTGSSLVFVADGSIELMEALQADIPDWRLFLHPGQKMIVQDNSPEAMVITGGPGTGKTSVILNRLLSRSPKGKDADCAVLLTYSQELAGELYKLVRRKAENRYFHVFPMYFLAGKVPQKSWSSALSDFALKISDTGLMLTHRGNGPRRVRELLIDEAQDMPTEAINMLHDLIQSRHTRVIMALDLEQTIYRANSALIEKLFYVCPVRYDLSYSYRLTRQVLEAANAWKIACGYTPTTFGRTALSGPKVQWIECEDISEQLKLAEDLIHDLEQRYSSEALALLFGQYFNPSYRGDAKEERAIQNNYLLDRYFKYANVSKGKEYYAGVIFVSESFLSRELPDKERRLRSNTIYVALTRFRDEVTVLYPKQCPARELLSLASSYRYLNE